MKVLNEKPPIYDEAKAAFDFDEKTTIFTYGDTIYNPAGIVVSLDLITHERIHELQQTDMHTHGKLLKNGPKKWWKKYIADSDFRFHQELEAYAAQYEYYKRNIKDRNRLNAYLVQMARELEGPMYGNMKRGGLYEVMRQIREY